MRIAITGAKGLIGSAVSAALSADGHSIIPVICSGRRAAGDAVALDFAHPDAEHHPLLNGLDAFIHLAGESIAAGRWTRARKTRILESRMNVTDAVFRILAGLAEPPRVALVASAIGVYGDRGAEVLTEDSIDSAPGLSIETARGADFLALVCRSWEAATQTREACGMRIVNLRFGAVLSAKGGALAQMLPIFRLGLGGVVGSGEQYFSWVALDDVAGAITHALTCTTLCGPINIVSANAVTNAEFTKTLGKVLRRPTLFPVPAFAARLALGELADGLLLASQRVAPKRLLDSGYRFRHPVLEDALRHTLAR